MPAKSRRVAGMARSYRNDGISVQCLNMMCRATV
ncbi:hypothetical protein SAMN05216193_101180 [Pseudomonas jinjuensis]|uniref:Uncharacterized protein n=1 Tax=Pseudomonas jinjuensis TaxID=198616 RepID=A0A1G9YTT2_9PSED|nr:hypothetical protein SAMN05216193_101180 [Pseudomonas jinjuensis]